MSGTPQVRRLQIVAAIVALICVVALLIPHAASHGPLFVCVLFFPVFLYGSLDLAELFRIVAYPDDRALPEAPVFRVLFQRPPPALD